MKYLFSIFAAVAALGVVVAHYLVFEYVPMEPEMRAVQRIFYFHVPSAWLCFIGFLGCFGASIGYLATRKSHLDVWRHRLDARSALGSWCLGRLVEMGAATDQYGTPHPHICFLLGITCVRWSWRRHSEILCISRSTGDTEYLFRENGCQEMAR